MGENMKNRLKDLNDHLFAQLERLNDESLKQDRIDAEIRRARAVVLVAKEITAVAALLLKGKVAQGESITGMARLPDAFE